VVTENKQVEKESEEIKNPLLWNYHSKRGFFKREEYYFAFQCLFLMAIIFFCRSSYFYYWQNSFLKLGSWLSQFFLGMQTIMNGGYSGRTKGFYALYYLFMPLYFVNGLVASFFISPKRYEILIVRIHGLKLLFFVFLTFVCALLPLGAPMVGFEGPIVLVIFNAVMTTGLIYIFARMIVAFVIKSNLKE
jgi:hypothetical protein